MKQEFSRRSFLHAAGLTALCMGGKILSPPLSRASDRKPNIVILYSDDQGYGDVGCYGAADMQTPHIDSLAASGSRFTSWYSNAPICSPSRASLLTGRYPQRVGVPGNVGAGYAERGLYPSEITLAELLKQNGYRTGLSGKWHLGGAPECRPPAQGFEESFGFYNGCIDYYSHIFYWGLGGGVPPMYDLWKNGQEVWENGQYLNDLIIREAQRFIRNHREEPFFLYVPFNAPHYPMHASPEYWERVSHIQDPHRRAQAAMVSVLDDGVGAVVAEIERNGLRNDTLIFFISDNGPSAEERNLLDDSREVYRGGSSGEFRGHKFDLFEGGIRVPAIASRPGVIPQGRVIEELTATIDVYPTVAEFAGAPLPTDRTIDGKSIAPLLIQNTGASHDAIFWESGNQSAVRQGDWKLILVSSNKDKPNPINQEFLFNIKDDPRETTNLADQKPEFVNDLKEKIDVWKKKVASQ